MLSLVFVLAELRETRGLELEMTQALPAHSGFLHDGPPKTRRLFCPTSQARRAKIFAFPKDRSYDLKKSARASQEGRFANATTRGAGCDGRVVPQGVRRDAYGQAVWS